MEAHFVSSKKGKLPYFCQNVTLEFAQGFEGINLIDSENNVVGRIVEDEVEFRRLADFLIDKLSIKAKVIWIDASYIWSGDTLRGLLEWYKD